MKNPKVFSANVNGVQVLVKAYQPKAAAAWLQERFKLETLPSVSVAPWARTDQRPVDGPQLNAEMPESCPECGVQSEPFAAHGYCPTEACGNAYPDQSL